MAVTADEVVVLLEAQTRRHNQQIADARRQFQTQMDQIRRSGTQTERQVSRSFERMASVARTALASVAAGIGIREIQQYADAWTTAGNKIAAAEEISGLQVRTLSEINEIAQRTRSGLEETADLYAKLTRAAGDVVESENQIAAVTETVNKAFKAGGAAATEQTASILQLAQALSSGFLQGDELRSLRENAPLIAQAIADEFETTIGGLKQLGADGEITTDRIVSAILKAQPEIEAAFARTNATIGEGFTHVRNAIIEYLGNSDDALGATEKLVAALQLLAENLEIVVAVMGVLAIRGVAPLVVALGTRLVAAAMTAVTALQLLTVSGGTALVATQVLGRALALLGGPVGALFTVVTSAAGAWYFFSEGATSAADAQARLANTIAETQSTMRDLASAQDSVRKDTDRLSIANEELAKAIALSEPAAISAAAVEVEAIRQRIAANQKLIGTYKAVLAAQRVALQAELGVAERRFVRENAGSGFTAQELMNEASPALLDPDLRGRRQEAEVAARLVAAEERALANSATAADAALLRQNATLQEQRAEVELLTEALSDLENINLEVEPVSTTINARPGGAGDGKKGKKAKEPKTPFDDEIAGLKERSELLRANILAQQELNPLTDDYATALERASIEQDLLNAAQEQGIELTPEFRTKVRELAQSMAELADKASRTGRFGAAADAIRDEIASIEAETRALQEVNPMFEDYGRAAARAGAEQELLRLAQEAGIPITAELGEQIRALAGAYGEATAASNLLAEQKAQLEEIRDVAKDTFRGFIDDIRDGKTGVEALTNALGKLNDKLLDLAIDRLFQGGQTGGGLFGFLSGLSKLFGFGGGTGGTAFGAPNPISGVYGRGGIADEPSIFGDAGPEAAVPLPDGRRIPVDLRLPDMSRMVMPVDNQPLHIELNQPITIDRPGAQMEEIVRRIRTEVKQGNAEVIGEVAKRNNKRVSYLKGT